MRKYPEKCSKHSSLFLLTWQWVAQFFRVKLRDTCEEVGGVWENNELQTGGTILRLVTEFITASKSPFWMYPNKNDNHSVQWSCPFNLSTFHRLTRSTSVGQYIDSTIETIDDLELSIMSMFFLEFSIVFNYPPIFLLFHCI